MSHEGFHKNVSKTSAKDFTKMSAKRQQNRSMPRIQAAFGSNNVHNGKGRVLQHSQEAKMSTIGSILLLNMVLKIHGDRSVL